MSGLTLRKAIWAAKRLAFYVYMGLCFFTFVGGYLTAPLFSYLLFNDWRFWYYVKQGSRLYPHAWKWLVPILRGENGGFLFSVPLTAPPRSRPDPEIAMIRSQWNHGASCGDCFQCCDRVDCPILDREAGKCLGYQSFYWRYFNCGRFPTRQSEIDYYGCPKWEIIGENGERERMRAGAG